MLWINLKVNVIMSKWVFCISHIAEGSEQAARRPDCCWARGRHGCRHEGVGHGKLICLFISYRDNGIGFYKYFKLQQWAQKLRISEVEHNVQPLLMDWPGWQSSFSDKNTDVLEDIPVKFRWIPFRSFREVDSVSANQRSWRKLS